MLVTGGAGFIGSHFIDHLLRAEPQANVVNLDLLTYAGNLDNLREATSSSRYHFVQGDVADGDLVQEVLRRHDIDSIVHFAAESHVDASIAGPRRFVHSNVVGTFTLLEGAQSHWQRRYGADFKDCRFHHVSTDEVYGSLSPDSDPVVEGAPYLPNSPYSATKAGSDHLVRAYHQTYGLPVTTSHCGNNYGPRQHHEKLIPTVVRACVRRQPIPIYGDGMNVREWLYVGDHCAAVDEILRHGQPGCSYNVGRGVEVNNLELVERICSLVDELRPSGAPHRELIAFVEDRPGHDRRYAIDCARIHRELDWHPAIGLEQGLSQTIRWYVDAYARET